MVANDLLDDEAQELFPEFGIELGLLRDRAQARNLPVFALGISRLERVQRLVNPYRLGNSEPFRQDVDQRGVDVVDALAIAGQNGIGLAARVRSGLSRHGAAR